MKTITPIILTSVCVIVPVLAQHSSVGLRPGVQLIDRPPNPALSRGSDAERISAGQDYPTSHTGVRFAPLHIYLDSGARPLAAFQFELKATAGRVKIVGVEGGSHEALSKTPPYYDPAALMNDRIIIAAFSTQRNLPKGRTRIATLHLQIDGDAEPQYELKLIVAADADGKEIPAKITLEKGEQK